MKTTSSENRRKAEESNNNKSRMKAWQRRYFLATGKVPAPNHVYD